VNDNEYLNFESFFSNNSLLNNFSSSFDRAVLAHRRSVILIWVIVFMAGGFAASRVVNRLSYNFATPGQSGYVASQKTLQHFGNGGQNAPAMTVIAGVDSSNSSTVGTALKTVAKQYPSIRFVNSFNAPGLDLLRHCDKVVYLFTGPPTSLPLLLSPTRSQRPSPTTFLRFTSHSLERQSSPQLARVLVSAF
jgi:hypothetical protein